MEKTPKNHNSPSSDPLRTVLSTSIWTLNDLNLPKTKQEHRGWSASCCQAPIFSLRSMRCKCRCTAHCRCVESLTGPCAPHFSLPSEIKLCRNGGRRLSGGISLFYTSSFCPAGTLLALRSVLISFHFDSLCWHQSEAQLNVIAEAWPSFIILRLSFLLCPSIRLKLSQTQTACTEALWSLACWSDGEMDPRCTLDVLFCLFVFCTFLLIWFY